MSDSQNLYPQRALDHLEHKPEPYITASIERCFRFIVTRNKRATRPSSLGACRLRIPASATAAARKTSEIRVQRRLQTRK
jgi:hypothetical protein